MQRTIEKGLLVAEWELRRRSSVWRESIFRKRPCGVKRSRASWTEFDFRKPATTAMTRGPSYPQFPAGALLQLHHMRWNRPRLAISSEGEPCSPLAVPSARTTRSCPPPPRCAGVVADDQHRLAREQAGERLPAPSFHFFTSRVEAVVCPKRTMRVLQKRAAMEDALALAAERRAPPPMGVVAWQPGHKVLAVGGPGGGAHFLVARPAPAEAGCSITVSSKSTTL